MKRSLEWLSDTLQGGMVQNGCAAHSTWCFGRYLPTGPEVLERTETIPKC